MRFFSFFNWSQVIAIWRIFSKAFILLLLFFGTTNRSFYYFLSLDQTFVVEWDYIQFVQFQTLLFYWTFSINKWALHRYCVVTWFFLSLMNSITAYSFDDKCFFRSLFSPVILSYILTFYLCVVLLLLSFHLIVATKWIYLNDMNMVNNKQILLHMLAYSNSNSDKSSKVELKCAFFFQGIDTGNSIGNDQTTTYVRFYAKHNAVRLFSSVLLLLFA